MPKVILVGLGNMGKKYLRKLIQLGIEPVLCDLDESLAKLFPNFEFYCFFEDISPSGKEKVIVAVKPEDHPKVASHFLLHGAEVLLEKPPAGSYREFKALLERFGKKGMAVSEIERYSYAFRGFSLPPTAKSIEIKRLNPTRGYINPVWDLAWHDLYLLLTLSEKLTLEGLERLREEHYLIRGTLNGVPFRLEVAWNYSDPKREWIVETSQGKILLDFRNERRIEEGKIVSERKEGDKLLEMVTDFLEGRYDPKSVDRALRILEILERIGRPN